MSDYLPDGLIVNMLRRLPIKSIIRCMCVCKRWKSIICTHHFITSHLNFTLSNSPPQRIFRYFDINFDKLHLSLHSSYDSFPSDKIDLHCVHHLFNRFHTIVGSSYGLLCLTCDDPQSEDYQSYVLCNPSIPKAILLPLPNIRFETHELLDQSRGFGYDPRTLDYKLVRVAYLDNPAHCLVEIYTLRTGMWRNVNAPGPRGLIHDKTVSVFLNGAVHWFGHTDPRAHEEEEDDTLRNVIVVFDMVHELFNRFIAVPECFKRVKHLRMRVAVVDGFLGLVPYSSIGMIDEVRTKSVWVMREYGVAESWTKLFDIKVEAEIERVVGFTNNGEVLVVRVANELLFSEPRSGTISIRCVGCNVEPLYLETFVESLALLDATDGVLGRRVLCSCNHVPI